MSLTDTAARQRRPIRSGVGLLLYLLAITFTPLVHAQTEREFGAASFEASHSAQCLPLHDEAVCPSCGAHQTLGSPTAVTSVDQPATTIGAPCLADAVAPPVPTVPPPDARAPPR